MLKGIVVSGFRILFLLAVIGSEAQVNAGTVINIDARVNGDPASGNTPVWLFLPAGTYEVTLVNPTLDTQAQYMAWSDFRLFSPMTGEIRFWRADYEIRTMNGTVLLKTPVLPPSSSPQVAFTQASANIFQFEVPTDQQVQFFVPNTSLSDNSGGVSVHLTQVIEDSDGDGIPDDEDACPSSDLRETVFVDECDTGVPNFLDESGCTLADHVGMCVEGAINQGQYVERIASLTNAMKKAGILTGAEKGAIQRCAAQANLP
jgi:hypothetical protein